MSMWDDNDFFSADPLVRFNAHQLAKGNSPLRDPDIERKRVRENRDADIAAGDSADSDSVPRGDL